MEVSQHFIQMSKSYDTYRERLKDIKKMQDELFEMEKKLTTVDDKIKKDQKAKKSTDMLEREAADLKVFIYYASQDKTTNRFD